MFGFVSQHWAAIQQSEYIRQNSRRSGDKWVRELIPQMWEIIWSQWRHRNTILHRTNKTTGTWTMDAVDQDIQQEIQLGMPPRCPTHLQRFFCESTLTTIHSKNAFDQRLWLGTVQRIRAMVTTLAVDHDGLSAERRLMQRWLATPAAL